MHYSLTQLLIRCQTDPVSAEGARTGRRGVPGGAFITRINLDSRAAHQQ